MEFAKMLLAGGAKKEAESHLERAVALAPGFEPAKQMLDAVKKGEIDKFMPPPPGAGSPGGPPILPGPGGKPVMPPKPTLKPDAASGKK
ncbi:hypothetical protein ACFL2Q_03025 [Thermodesulfobacteriota bacterium]